MNWFLPKLINPESGEIEPFLSPVSKVVCVGRNYIEHARELNNPVPVEPLLFIKPNSTLCSLSQVINIPKGRGECHHELEIAILIGKNLTDVDAEAAEKGIAGLGLALDLTLRQLQSSLKEKGHPWERAKAFDGACPVSHFVPFKNQDLTNLDFQMLKNGKVSQKGNSEDMIFPIVQLIADISKSFSLLPGDIILTGTPAGVGPLNPGDQLVFEFMGCQWENTEVES
ncbi:fumarylacetoacetate hydrolase family protein [Aliikangiella sp. G2MR2-5]|uniref:fumarylacetoacetate hydrolase family protein n=1 Tax=Aliikangiella sp. G2MR2-5 TaxID=2788943 RepID=UPI001FEFF650|nr:fumarylacetoacetate hydrolase family protein [Aliikangiella sp. G2MR2-5]